MKPDDPLYSNDVILPRYPDITKLEAVCFLDGEI